VQPKTIMNFWTQLRSWISACARCRSLRPPIHIFCEECWEILNEIENTENDLRQAHYSFAVYSLYTWSDEFDFMIRPLIYALKGGVIHEPWVLFATRFLYLRSQLGLDWTSNSQIVIAPRKNKKDHAFYWARSLSEQSQIQVLDCLQSEGPLVRQKSLSFAKRQDRSFVSRGLERHPETKFIFVDDTITSGGTAQAVFEAIGCPQDFEVWTLVSKPRFGVH
jgi:predicted amidophosphoribosyltransferase